MDSNKQQSNEKGKQLSTRTNERRALVLPSQWDVIILNCFWRMRRRCTFGLDLMRMAAWMITNERGALARSDQWETRITWYCFLESEETLYFWLVDLIDGLRSTNKWRSLAFSRPMRDQNYLILFPGEWWDAVLLDMGEYGGLDGDQSEEG